MNFYIKLRNYFIFLQFSIVCFGIMVTIDIKVFDFKLLY